MKRKLLSRVSAVAMASAMMVSMFGMTTFAEGGVLGGDESEAITNVDITKIVTTDGKSYAPDETFTFKVETGEKTTYYDEVVYAGVPGGLLPGAGADFDSDAELNNSYTKIGTLTTDASVFEGPGIYHYVVSENAGNFAGITYDNAVYDVYLYVYGNGDEMYVGNIATVKQGQEGGKADLTFTNDYGKNNGKLHDLTVTKDVTGNQGDTEKEFEFTITITGDEDNERFYMDVEGRVYTLVSGEEQSFGLADGESAVIYGLSEGDKYVVTETDYTETDGYTTSVKVNNNDAAEALTTDEVTMGAADNNVVFTNNKEVSTPTGIIMNIAPYIILVAFAGIAALVFLRRRNREF